MRVALGGFIGVPSAAVDDNFFNLDNFGLYFEGVGSRLGKVYLVDIRACPKGD